MAISVDLQHVLFRDGPISLFLWAVVEGGGIASADDDESSGEEG